MVIKGDVLVTFRKSALPDNLQVGSDIMIIEKFISSIEAWLSDEPLDTNEIFLRIMKMVFAEKILIGNVDLLKILTENFEFSETQKWVLYDELVEI